MPRSPTKPNTLKDIITRMVLQAEREAFKPSSRVLPRGLRISITFEKRFFNLELSRQNVPPSLEEWDAVLEAWPYQAFGQCLTDLIGRNILHGQIETDKSVRLF